MDEPSVVIAGKSGSGKSNFAQSLIRRLSREAQILVLDPEQGSLGWDVFRANGGWIDSLDQPVGLVNPLEWDTPKKRELVSEAFIAIRGLTTMDGTPLLQQTLDYWLRLIPTHWTIEQGLEVLYNQARLDEAINQCRDQEVAMWWMQLPASSISRERVIGPLQRLLNCLRDPLLRARLNRNGYSIQQVLENPNVRTLVVEGGHEITESATRLYFRWLLKSVLEYKKANPQRPLAIVIEEAEAYQLIGGYEAKVMQVARKYNVRLVLICQEPLFGDPEITTKVMNNTSHVWFSCGEEVAEIAAKDCAVMHNPNSEKQRTERPVFNEGDEFTLPQIDYWTFGEQHQLIKQFIMQQTHGEAIWRIGRNALRIAVPLVNVERTNEDAWRQYLQQEWLVSSLEEQAARQTISSADAGMSSSFDSSATPHGPQSSFPPSPSMETTEQHGDDLLELARENARRRRGS